MPAQAFIEAAIEKPSVLSDVFVEPNTEKVLSGLLTHPYNRVRAVAIDYMRTHPEKFVPFIGAIRQDPGNYRPTESALFHSLTKFGKAIRRPDPKQVMALLDLTDKGESQAPAAIPAFADSKTIDIIFERFQKSKLEDDSLEVIIELGKTFGTLSERLAPSEREKWVQKLKQHFLDPQIDPYGKRAIRRSLPPELKREVESLEIAAKLQMKTNPVDNCTLICNLATDVDKWAPGFDKPDIYFKKDMPLWTWQLAVKSLSGLFVSQASPYCSIPSGEANSLISKWFKAQDNQPSLKESIAEVKKNLETSGVKLSPEAAAGLDGFAAGKSTSVGYPINSAEIYGRSFYRMLGASFESRLVDSKADADVSRSLSQNLTDPTSYGFAESGDSILTTHLLATSVLGLSGIDSPEKRKALALLDNEVKCSKSKSREFGLPALCAQ